MNYYQIVVSYKTSIIFQVDQDFGEEDQGVNEFNKGFPTRMVVTKIADDRIEYISGKGQVYDRMMSKQMILDRGKYFILVQLEIQQDVQLEDFELIITTQSLSPINLSILKEGIPEKFYSRAYMDCARKYGDTVDLNK